LMTCPALLNFAYTLPLHYFCLNITTSTAQLTQIKDKATIAKVHTFCYTGHFDNSPRASYPALINDDGFSVKQLDDGDRARER
jgi:hypothetical protein